MKPQLWIYNEYGTLIYQIKRQYVVISREYIRASMHSCVGRFAFVSLTHKRS